MAIGVGSLIEIVLRQYNTAGRVYNTYQYAVSGTWPTITTAHLAEAWWNHVKTTQRALIGASFGAVIQSVTLRELNNPEGDYAEWDIPTAEQTGTRSTPTQNEWAPPFVAAGVRLTVGSRMTRPGQKRYGFLYENDLVSANLSGAYITLLRAHMDVMTTTMGLGAPAATIALQPVVCKKDAAGVVLASQFVIGYVINPYVTTQNTRKMGRGV